VGDGTVEEEMRVAEVDECAVACRGHPVEDKYVAGARIVDIKHFLARGKNHSEQDEKNYVANIFHNLSF
jgi:hypothetical protein